MFERARLVVCIGAFLYALLCVSAARADDARATCLEQNLVAQAERKVAHFAEARAALTRCADVACPAVVRDDCASRLEDLARDQPSLVFDIKDERGADLIDVTVLLDGQPLTSRLNGTAIDVDPGVHVLTFEAAGRPRVTRQLLVKEGELRRREPVALPLLTMPPVPRGLGTLRLTGLVAAAASLVGLGVGAGFGAAALSEWSNAKSVCGGAPAECSSAANATRASAFRGSGETDAAISTAGFIGGGVLMAAGAVLFFAGRPHHEAARSAWTLTPVSAPGQAGLQAAGSF